VTICQRLAVCLMTILLALPCLAVTPAGSDTPDALLTTKSLSRWMAGIEVGFGKRTVLPENGPAVELEWQDMDVLLGIDVTDWLSFLGSFGTTDAEFNDINDPGSDGDVWSLRVNANLWQWENEGEYPSWRLTLKSLNEFSSRQAESENGMVEMDWDTLTLALPLGWEILFAEGGNYFSDLYRITYYIGPAFSTVDGTRTVGGTDAGFEEDTEFGVVGGVTVYLLANLSLGADAEYYENLALRGSLIFHF
jgi:hypothetical protein